MASDQMKKAVEAFNALSHEEKFEFLHDTLEAGQHTLFGIPIYPSGLRKFRRKLLMKNIRITDLIED